MSLQCTGLAEAPYANRNRGYDGLLRSTANLMGFKQSWKHASECVCAVPQRFNYGSKVHSECCASVPMPNVLILPENTSLPFLDDTRLMAASIAELSHTLADYFS